MKSLNSPTKIRDHTYIAPVDVRTNAKEVHFVGLTDPGAGAGDGNWTGTIRNSNLTMSTGGERSKGKIIFQEAWP